MTSCVRLAATPNSATPVAASTTTRRPPETGWARPRMASVISPNIRKPPNQARCAAVHHSPGCMSP
ncbi:hypothetical protein [Nonomuraea salmonea]|uniref:hypothetical protein n=1 Tax=Nonomuraea salmonea TaxID=46181 RepID=UPI0031E612F1